MDTPSLAPSLVGIRTNLPALDPSTNWPISLPHSLFHRSARSQFQGVTLRQALKDVTKDMWAGRIKFLSSMGIMGSVYR